MIRRRFLQQITALLAMPLLPSFGSSSECSRYCVLEDGTRVRFEDIRAGDVLRIYESDGTPVMTDDQGNHILYRAAFDAKREEDGEWALILKDIPCER